MDALLADWKDVHWWVSVVVIGIFINIFSSYLKRPIDWCFEKMGSWLHSWSKKSLQDWENRVESIAESDRRLAIELSREQTERLAAMGALVFIILCGTVVVILGLSGQATKGIVSFFYGMAGYSVFEVFRRYMRAVNAHVAIEQAELRRLSSAAK